MKEGIVTHQKNLVLLIEYNYYMNKLEILPMILQ